MNKLRRITSLFILISIVFSFTPVFNGHVYAAGKKLKTPKIKSATVVKNKVILKWTKIKHTKYYEVKVRTIKNKLVYIAYSSAKKRSYKFDGLKYNTRYKFSVRAVNKEKHSKWKTVKRKTVKSPYEKYPKLRITEANKDNARKIYNKLISKTPFVIIIKANSYKDAKTKFKLLKKEAAKLDDLKVNIGELKVDYYGYDDSGYWFHNGSNYYIPVVKSDIDRFFAAKRYIKLAYDERTKAWLDLVASFSNSDYGEELSKDFSDYFRCPLGTPYHDLSLESRLIYAMPSSIFQDSTNKDYMVYNHGSGKRTNIDFNVSISPRTFNLLYQKKAYGKCSEFAAVCRAICSQLGVRSWYCEDFGIDHGWAAAKFKNNSGKTCLYIMNNGKVYVYDSAKSFKTSELYKGTKEGMGKSFPF